MKIKIFSSVIVMLVLCFTIAEAQNSGKVLTFKGYKNIEIGMKIKNVAKATGLTFSYDSPPENNECTYAYTKSLPGLYLMLVNEVVARIDVDKGDYTTLEGAKPGDSEETIKKLYPKIEIEGQKYIPEGHYLIVRSPDKSRAIIFDTDGKKVTAFRVGRMPEVEYVEGCN
ncbi:MAG: hypothetical protein NT178_03840 [Proteobacteria bacterium]|nr:hypothetical protein [Pseudomonadota bacterium]